MKESRIQAEARHAAHGVSCMSTRTTRTADGFWVTFHGPRKLTAARAARKALQKAGYTVLHTTASGPTGAIYEATLLIA